MARWLQDKVALITGGSAGIGLAAAKCFANAGARVVIVARDGARGKRAVDEMKDGGQEVAFVQADVSQPEDVGRAVRETVNRYGRLDCAFNNAAVLGPIKRLADYSENEFDAEIRSNLRSVWLCMKNEIEQMLKQSPTGGTIVNTSSINGLGGAKGAALYSMAKAGVQALTKSAALEYAADGIRLNALVAGGFATEMLQSAVKKVVGEDPAKIEEGLKSYATRVPLGRIGDPAEAAEAALWLLSGASSYVTGESMIVDGGLTCWAR